MNVVKSVIYHSYRKKNIEYINMYCWAVSSDDGTFNLIGVSIEYHTSTAHTLISTLKTDTSQVYSLARSLTLPSVALAKDIT